MSSAIHSTDPALAVQLFNEMYFPSDWSNLVNNVYPQVVQIVNGEGPANVSYGLSRRSKDRVRLNPYVGLESFTWVRGLELTSPMTSRLVKRGSQPNDSPSFTAAAVFCADSVDLRGTTMKEVFQGIVSTSQNVSHLCA